MREYLVVEDDALHRSFLAEVLRLAAVDCTRVVEAADGEQAIALARARPLHGVVMDLQLPRATGVQAARAIWSERPSMPIVFWSNFSDEAYVRGIARIVPPSAVYGYLLKTASKERLGRSLEGIFNEGQCIVDREVRGGPDRGRRPVLTEAEYEVLLDIAVGLTDRAIARRRRLSLRSVQGRLQTLYGKLGLDAAAPLDGDAARYNTRTRSIAVALANRLINAKSIEIADEDYRRWAGDDDDAA